MESAEIGALLDEALQLCQAGALTQAEQIYRQKPDGDWSAALGRLEQNLKAEYGKR